MGDAPDELKESPWRVSETYSRRVLESPTAGPEGKVHLAAHPAQARMSYGDRSGGYLRHTALPYLHTPHNYLKSRIELGVFGLPWILRWHRRRQLWSVPLTYPPIPPGPPGPWPKPYKPAFRAQHQPCVWCPWQPPP